MEQNNNSSVLIFQCQRCGNIMFHEKIMNPQFYRQLLNGNGNLNMIKYSISSPIQGNIFINNVIPIRPGQLQGELNCSTCYLNIGKLDFYDNTTFLQQSQYFNARIFQLSQSNLDNNQSEYLQFQKQIQKYQSIHCICLRQSQNEKESVNLLKRNTSIEIANLCKKLRRFNEIERQNFNETAQQINQLEDLSQYCFEAVEGLLKRKQKKICYENSEYSMKRVRSVSLS